MDSADSINGTPSVGTPPTDGTPGAELGELAELTHTPTSLSLNGLAPANSRRPPRKSTLTQQQKNQKRQRATQDQLTMLEVEFNKNPTPTAMTRERIANDINMTERSVQIWFQNRYVGHLSSRCETTNNHGRRAKIKNMAKKSIETGEDCDAIPESMRKYLAMQALESGKPLVRDMGTRGLTPYSNNGLIMNAESQAKVCELFERGLFVETWLIIEGVVIQHLQCRSLSIGTWRRISQTALDLVVFYSPAKAMFTYYINADSSGFKIEYPFSSIKNITLDTGDASAGVEGASQRSGGLVVELTHPPSFSMDPGSGGFFQCRDFTEDQQASQVLVHHLGGHSKVLSGQLAKLVSLDSFRGRHSLAEPTQFPMSAPVSPLGMHRPSSQPNQIFLHPHAAYMDHSQGTMTPPASRVGHKRQRSRSVPAVFDPSQLRRPLPPFLQQEVNAASPRQSHFQQPHIHAPIPQHLPQPVTPQPPTTFEPVGSSLTAGSNLTINTTAAGYDFEFRAGPMSATTVNSTGTENFFLNGPPSETYSHSNMQTPYTGTFYSPMVNPSSLSNPPVSPYTHPSHGEPIIANQSPPMGFDRNGSAELYPGAQDQTGLQSDGFNFDEYYGHGKNPAFHLPIRHPEINDQAAQDPPDFNFQEFCNFDGASASNISSD